MPSPQTLPFPFEETMSSKASSTLRNPPLPFNLNIFSCPLTKLAKNFRVPGRTILVLTLIAYKAEISRGICNFVFPF